MDDPYYILTQHVIQLKESIIFNDDKLMKEIIELREIIALKDIIIQLRYSMIANDCKVSVSNDKLSNQIIELKKMIINTNKKPLLEEIESGLRIRLDMQRYINNITSNYDNDIKLMAKLQVDIFTLTLENNELKKQILMLSKI